SGNALHSSPNHSPAEGKLSADVGPTGERAPTLIVFYPGPGVMKRIELPWVQRKSLRHYFCEAGLVGKCLYNRLISTKRARPVRTSYVPAAGEVMVLQNIDMPLGQALSRK